MKAQNKQDTIRMLRQLAAHLRSDQRIHKIFYFGNLNSFLGKECHPVVKHCGTAGCAMGEFPALWPEDWRFQASGGLVYGDNPLYFMTSICNSAARFLNLSQDESYHLFWPDSQMPVHYGGKRLTELATAEEVAANIDAFIVILEQRY